MAAEETPVGLDPATITLPGRPWPEMTMVERNHAIDVIQKELDVVGASLADMLNEILVRAQAPMRVEFRPIIVYDQNNDPRLP